MELWVVLCVQSPDLLPRPDDAKDVLSTDLSNVWDTWGLIVGFFFGLAAMQYTYELLTKSYTPVIYPLPRRPASIAERISFIYASKGVGAATTTDDNAHTFGW